MTCASHTTGCTPTPPTSGLNVQVLVLSYIAKIGLISPRAVVEILTKTV